VHPGARRHRDRDGAPAEASRPLGHLEAHVGDVLVLDRADPVEQRFRSVRVVGVDVDPESGFVAHDQHRVAKRLEHGLEATAI
jgi:hypothetical protein